MIIKDDAKVEHIKMAPLSVILESMNTAAISKACVALVSDVLLLTNFHTQQNVNGSETTQCLVSLIMSVN